MKLRLNENPQTQGGTRLPDYYVTHPDKVMELNFLQADTRTSVYTRGEKTEKGKKKEHTESAVQQGSAMGTR